MKMSNIKRCYNVAATLLATYNVAATLFRSKVATQRCGNARVTFLDYVFTTFTQCCGNCYNLKLLAGFSISHVY